MKLPFDLGLKLFFRMLIPGFFLTLGLLPFLYNLWDWAAWGISSEYTLIIAVILMGWLVSSLDMFIYMLYEGRRYWPGPLRSHFLDTEKQRLVEILAAQRRFENTDKQKYLEATVEKRKFPLNANGKPEALFPTRLGNTITAYESYPDSRYGIDPIFYWYRIWLGLDKDLKEEVENRSAVADSAVYSSFALFVSSLCWLIYAILTSSPVKTLNYLPRPAVGWSLFLFFLLTGYGTYRTSVLIHTQFGEIYKSIYDLHLKDINVRQIIKQVARITNTPSLLKSNRPEQLLIAWRYLQNYLIKCPVCGEFVSPTEFENHHATLHAALPTPAVSPAPTPTPISSQSTTSSIPSAVSSNSTPKDSSVIGNKAVNASEPEPSTYAASTGEEPATEGAGTKATEIDNPNGTG
jgi:hypothetical protein